MAAMTTVTVATGKKLVVSRGGARLEEYSATETVSIPTHEAARLKAQGIVTY